MTLDRPDPQDIVIVGATGNLSRRKLLPALYNLFRAGLLPEVCSLIGVARTKLNSDSFRSLAHEAVEASADADVDEPTWDGLPNS